MWHVSMMLERLYRTKTLPCRLENTQIDDLHERDRPVVQLGQLNSIDSPQGTEARD